VSFKGTDEKDDSDSIIISELLELENKLNLATGATQVEFLAY